jgi:predicted CXXCH cytochrome family protein
MKTLLRIAVLVALTTLGSPFLGNGAAQLEGQAPKHNCSFCHNLHGGAYGALMDFEVVEDLCVSCHGDAGPAQVDRDGTFVDIPKQESIHDGAKHVSPTSCRECHAHEGDADTNLFMVPRTMTVPQGGTATVTFTNNAAQADFVGSEGVCYVCHTDVATQNTGFAGHNGPDVCTTCHDHDGGFQGAGGGCSGCHNSTRLADGHTHAARRQVTGTGGDYDLSSVHVTSVTDDDCVVCHDQRDGHSGDNLGVLLYDHDDGTSIELTHGGDPNTSSTEAAKLEQFCLGCHGDGSADRTGVTFPTGASATQPFSSLVTIPDVDSLVWAASSHEGGVTGGCYGNGAFGCHGNGHGSNLENLRAPYNSTLNATTLYEQEEGFCFNCHTSGGAASTDIDAQFATPINWSESEWGLNQITTFNDRHDVQHAAADSSGAKIECVNCHRPHADNSSQKYNPDPDPGNTPPSWTGQSAMDAFCADCHDGTFPAGVEGHKDPADGVTPIAMTDVASAWATEDGMGAVAGAATNEREYVMVERSVGAGGTTGATDGSGDMDLVLYADAFGADPVLNCTQCHRPHPKAAANWPGTYKYDLLSYQDSVRLSDGRALAYPIDIVDGRMGNPSIYTGVWDFGLTDDFAPPTVEAAGGFTCNACHARENMNTKTEGCATGGGCHSHGPGGNL